MRADKKSPLKADKKTAARSHKRGVVTYGKKAALLEDAITQMNAGKYGRSSAALKELLALDPHNMEARRLFATLHLRLGSLIPARQAFDSLIGEAFERQDYWLAESLLREYLAVGPRCVPFIEKLGAVYQQKGDALEAVAEYGKAIDILIEDPDPDNPQHASQLYAKIRDLAPASPVAFRLAASFDAQTGELIARPQVTQTAAIALESPISVEESAVPGATMPEPMAGVMPWEQGIEEPSPFSSASPIAAIPPVAAEETHVSARVVDRFTDQNVNASDVLQSPAAEPAVAHETSAIEAGGVAAETIAAGEPDSVPPSQPIVDDLGETDRVSSGASSFEVAKSVSAAVSTEEPEAETVRQESENIAAELPRAAGNESISAPMPWEEVQETTITILEPISNDTPAVALHSDVSLGVGSDPAHTAVQEIAHENTASATSTAEAFQTAPAIEGSIEVPSSRDATPANSFPDLVKGGGFSWESVFNSAWKFGDKASSAPEPEVSPAENLQAAAETPHSMVSSAETSASAFGEALPVQDSSSLDAEAPSAIAHPTPWDQVQDTIVTIPPAPVDDSLVDNPNVETSQAPDSIEQVQPSQESELLLTTASEQAPFSISQPPPTSLSFEPEFRLADMGEAVPITEPSPRSSDMPSGFSGNERMSEPLAVPDLAQETIEESTGQSDLTDQPSPEPMAPPMVQETEPRTEPPVADTLLSDNHEGEPIALRHAEPLIEPVSLSWNAAIAEVKETVDSITTQKTVSQESKEQVDHAPEPMPLAGQDSLPSHMAASRSVETPVAALTQAPAPSIDEAPHWKTGEVAVQTHRPSPKKRNKTAEPEITAVSASREETSERKAAENERHESAFADARARMPEPAHQEEWIRTGESIRFVEPQPSQPAEPAPQASMQTEAPVMAPPSTVAAAVDVLFESSGRLTRTATRERVSEPKPRPRLRAKLSRVRIAMTVFFSSCFSTTQTIVMSLVALVVLMGALTALVIGAVGLAWIIMEEPPSPAFHSLTTTPQRTLTDPKKNGYLLLLGFDAAAGLDPIQAGYERRPDGRDADMAAACVGGPTGGSETGQANASAKVANGWFQGADPVGQFRSHHDTIKGWMSQGDPALARYRQWVKLSFEDWGYGQSVSPPCTSILFAHRLYVADGFLQGSDAGIDRLETDMEAWRMALAQAKTLPVKTMALQAIHDDIAVASGLLVKPDFDGKALGRIIKLLRPFDQAELSIRWPMQGELVYATKTFDAQLKAERGDDPSWYAAVASALPLPKQRRFNDYAEYYEASYKAAGEGRYGSMPKWSYYIHFPAGSVTDYLGNPIENIIGLEPLARWDRYNALVVDTDAHLRLGSLQAWLRRGPQDADLLARIAKAGQGVYDPYTGLPMLVNLKKGVMYSVGHDGQDQDADPQNDVVVAIPVNSSSSALSVKSK